jgi:hypothetical protein
LKQNSHEQGLLVKKALLANYFFIEELSFAEVFLDQLEELFSNPCEDEEAKKSLLSLHQGNKNISEFMTQFMSALETTQLPKSLQQCYHLIHLNNVINFIY